MKEKKESAKVLWMSNQAVAHTPHIEILLCARHLIFGKVFLKQSLDLIFGDLAGTNCPSRHPLWQGI